MVNVCALVHPNHLKEVGLSPWAWGWGLSLSLGTALEALGLRAPGHTETCVGPS